MRKATKYVPYSVPDTRIVRDNEDGTITYLDRLIMNTPADMEVVHINGDPFDNRRCNLLNVPRPCLVACECPEEEASSN